jgi:hypothetical protein
MAIPTLIFCGGNNPRFAEIALSHGYKYGARLPATTYAPVYFADQEYKQPNRAQYMKALAEHRPNMATVLDWERVEQLPEVLSWAEEAAQYAERVLIIPKVLAGIERLPREICGKQIVLAYSVPSSYGGTPTPALAFASFPVHLLGGAPQMQMRLWRKMPSVVSVDGNMSMKMANKGMFWRVREGKRFRRVPEWISLKTCDGKRFNGDGNYEAFRRSCVNIKSAWEYHTKESAHF